MIAIELVVDEKQMYVNNDPYIQLFAKGSITMNKLYNNLRYA